MEDPRWSVTRVTDASTEPVTTAEMKTHLRVLHSDDDTYISGLTKTARKHVENRTGRAFVNQTFDYTTDDFPQSSTGTLDLPRSPLVSVTSVKYSPATSTSQSTLAATNYLVDTDSEPGRVYLKEGATWPTNRLRRANGVVVRFVAGYGTSATSSPEEAKHAIKLLGGHWYYNRGAVLIGSISKDLERTVDALTDDLNVKRYQ